MSGAWELYGLRVESELPLDGLPPRDPSPRDPPPVRIRVGEGPSQVGSGGVPVFTSEGIEGRPPALVATRTGEWFHLRYAEGATFQVRDDGGEVWCTWRAPLTSADATAFLLGPVLGFVLRLRGVLALHASAVVVGGRAWAFVGEGGSGKSTIAGALARDGCPVLTEDVLALRRATSEWLAYPAYDHVRIWERSEKLLLGEGSTLAAMSPTWDKRAMSLTAHGLPRARSAAPLGGWFLLDERIPAAQVGGPSSLQRLDRVNAVLDLSVNSYVAYLLDDRARALELPALGQLVEEVPVWWLSVGDGADGLAATVGQLRQVMSGVTT